MNLNYLTDLKCDVFVNSLKLKFDNLTVSEAEKKM